MTAFRERPPAGFASWAEWLSLQPREVQLGVWRGMTPAERAGLAYNWRFWAREAQLPPPGLDWEIWLYLAGRGSGKTRTGAETVIQWIKDGFEFVNLASRTMGDVRKTMIMGESGIIAKAPPELKPVYIVSLKELHWPDGRISLCFSADEPEQGRGPQSQKLWCDEFAAWPSFELWHNLYMGLRLEPSPQALLTTTGRKRKYLRELRKQANVRVTRGHTRENAANLPQGWLKNLLGTYENTKLGAQELYGDILDDDGGAYFDQDQIDENRRPIAPPLKRIAMGLDPSITKKKRSDKHGIVVSGLGYDDEIYVLADLSAVMSPGEWSAVVLKAYREWSVGVIVAEINRGGLYIVHTLVEAARGEGWEVVVLWNPEDEPQPGAFNIRPINTQEGKSDRAEPVSVKASKGKIHHVGDPANFRDLEDEICDWNPAESAYSPNQLDAYCYSINELSPPWELEKPDTGFHLL